MPTLEQMISSLRKARDEHHRMCERIDHALSAMGTPARGHRQMSKAARERIAEAQRQRWAKVKGKSAHSSNNPRKAGIKSYWGSMTPEERQAEMQRRVKVREKRKKELQKK